MRVVCATRLPADDFFRHTPTGRSILAFREASTCQVALYADNAAGLSTVYNHAIDAAVEQPAILVFIHDDCIIADFFWVERVRWALAAFDVVGVVGNRRRLPRQPSWIVVDPLTRALDDAANLSGAIGQGTRFPPEQLDVFGPSGLECKLLDGVFIASGSETLRHSDLRFDPQFPFHFYDMDFCRTAEARGLRLGTVPLSLIHASRGSMDQAWEAVYRRYLEKWGD